MPNNEKDGGLWVMKGSSKLFPELIKAFGLEDVSILSPTLAGLSQFR